MLAHFDKQSKMTLGLFFKEKREAARVTQIDLAKDLDLSSSQHISNVERGSSTFTAQQIIIISRVLKLDLEFVEQVLIRESIQSFKRTWDSQVQELEVPTQ